MFVNQMLILCLYRNQQVVRTPESKTFYNFRSFKDSDFDLLTMVNKFSEDLDHPKEIQSIKSSLIRFLVLSNDSIAFNWQITVELIQEHSDDVQKLHEYHKRWQAFTSSMIKMDELLIPITKTVNKVYELLYPGFPWNPAFSILRCFVNIWYKEVYKPLEFLLEKSMLSFLKTFHQGCKDYSRAKKLTNRWNRNKSSHSDYFPARNDNSPMVRTVQTQSISPMLKSNNLIRTPKTNLESEGNERILEFEDGQHTIIDIDMLYGHEPETNVPGFNREEKEIFKQILVDLLDISLNEYNVHYICHTDNQYGMPFEHMKGMVLDQIKSFFKYSVERMPFSLWDEVIREHYQILINILPLTMQKELVEMRFKFTKAYTRSRIERNWKEFQNRRQKNSPKEERKYQMFSTQASETDPTIVTEDEYQEIVVSDILNTPFYSFISEQINKPKTVTMAFLAYMKNEESEVIRAFNNCFFHHQEFIKSANLKNRGIENYKKQRGFPLKLGENEQMLFSFDHKITYKKLIDMKTAREKEEQKHQHVVKRKGFQLDQDEFFEGCDDFDSIEAMENLKPIKKKPTFQPLNEGRLLFLVWILNKIYVFKLSVLNWFEDSD